VTDPYVEAGARAILRRAITEHGIDGYRMYALTTDALVTTVREYRVDVGKIIGWWEIMASGKPHLTDSQRQIMLAACDRARELASVPR
jgi:hypothetical protein